MLRRGRRVRPFSRSHIARGLTLDSSASSSCVRPAPATGYPKGLCQRLVRREPFRLAVGENHRLAGGDPVLLSSLRDERFEFWPREMAPGFYDAVLSACRAAGFEPELDEHAAGSTVWGYIAAGRGVALVVGSLREQLPRGLKLLSFAPPQPPPLSINAVWNEGNGLPALEHFLETAEQLAADHKWT